MKNSVKNQLKVAIPVLLLGILIGFGINSWVNINSNKDVDTSAHLPIEESANLEVWTCSMHPQIRQNEEGICPICEMDLITLETNSSNDPLVLEMTQAAVQLANIQTTVIGKASAQMGKIIRLSGKVQADERRASSQVAHVPGRIEKLFVTFTGEQVNKGQKIAEVYSPELITAQRELLEALKLRDLNPDLVEAARNKLRYWKISEEVIRDIEEKGIIQETFVLHADESGIVTQRRVAVGDHLHEGSPLFDLMNLKKVWVLFDAYEEDLASISLGDKIEFNTPAIPGRSFQTSITFIDPVINPQTRVAALRTEITNGSGILKPEMLVTGTIQGKKGQQSQLSIPKTAVLWTGTRSVVYVKITDTSIPSFQYREVELGESLGDHYQLIGGLEAGEEVVTNGNFTIDAAAQLNNQASMMNQSVFVKGESGVEKILPDYTKETPVVFKQQISGLAKAYLSLKDAFVATDASLVQQETQPFLMTLSEVDMNLLEGEAHLFWMEQLNFLQTHGEKVKELNEIEAQRKQFDFLSQTLIQTIKVFGVSEQTFYIQHCPMAFNDTGADWISDVEEIRNPYFGDVMLKCGVVEEIITVGNE